MDITPPYAYSEIVPLNKEHKVLVPQGRKIPPAFRAVSALPVSLVEFNPIARDYPIVFVTGDSGTSFVAMAVLGLEQQQNLFLLADNTWDRRAYLPAYVRRYPFCMATITQDGKVREDRLVCVEKKAIKDKGDSLFDDKGEPLPQWVEQQKLLVEYEADLVRTNQFAAELKDLDLLEQFTMQAQPNQGTPLQLTGMFRVVEQKLAALDAARIKGLAERGLLGRIYAHMASLENFLRLLDRRAGMGQASAKASAN